MLLCDLQPGIKARVTRIQLQDNLLERRLVDLGVVENVTVQILAKAPFNGPIALCAKNQSFSIRQSDASCIIVDLL